MARAKTVRDTNSPEPDKTSDDQSVGLNEPVRAEIESRAYEIYLARGEVHGFDHDDWLQAEREVTEDQIRPNVSRNGTSRKRKP